MKKLGSSGGIIVTLILSLLLVSSLIFGLWAYAGRADYKSNVDKKIAAAVVIAKQQTQQADNQAFADQIKSPLKSFQGPATYGSLNVQYPKTWSAYVDISESSGGDPVIGYFQPDFVSDLQTTSFALRVRIAAASYSEEMLQFTNGATTGGATVTAYSVPKVPGVVGALVQGAIGNNKQGTMLLLPLRDKTIEIWTEASQYQADFTNFILPNITFSP